MSAAGYVGRTAETVAASYSIVVPPGFVRVPGGVDAQDAVAAVAAQLADRPDAGTGPAPDEWRIRFGSALDRALAADVDGRVLDSYLSTGPLPGTDMVCSIVVATVPVTCSEHADLDRLLLRRVATHGAHPFLLAGDPAVVWDEPEGNLSPQAEPARPDGRTALTTLRRRTVLARVAGRDDRLLTFVLTVGSATTGGPDASGVDSVDQVDDEARARMVDALSEVFDAMLSTFRWRDPDGRLVTDRPLA